MGWFIDWLKGQETCPAPASYNRGSMWIVRIALNRPYTFVVLTLLILLVSPLVIQRTPVDIFPNVNIPVVAILWNYIGLNAEEMEERISTVFERNLTTTVNDMEHSESQT